MTEPLPLMRWRLREIMVERGLPSIAALRRCLQPHYPYISEVQLGRVVNRLPERMNTPLLVALCHALECAPGDLLQWETLASDSAQSETPVRLSRAIPAPSPAEITRLKGPAFKVFSTTSEEGKS